MVPTSPSLAALVGELRASSDTSGVAYAHNYLFEERVTAERQATYEEGHPSAGSNLQDWRKHQRRYLVQRIWVPRGELPETFSTCNAAALVSSPDPEVLVIRLENLRDVLGRGLLDFARLEAAVRLLHAEPATAEGEDAKVLLTAFCSEWCLARRQDRPVFAAFHADVAKDCAAEDWPHRLRDRLGLGHLDVQPGEASIPVALVGYRVGDVLAAVARGEEDRAFAVPTVLDGPLSLFFFPAPKEAGFGRTLDLQPDPGCERLVSEILHRRMEYTPNHILKLGLISRPLPEDVARRPAQLRNGHLFCLRYETGREDFGEDILGDHHG